MTRRRKGFDLDNFPLTWRSHEVLLYLVSVSVVLASVTAQSDCGDYYDLGPSSTGTIYSPDYPNMYGTYSKCIWLIRTDDKYRVQLSVTFTGERYNGDCSDYLEIRDGNSSAALVAKLCDTHTAEVVRSTYRWMWVLFKSDGITGSATAMQATFSSFYNATTPAITQNAAPTCRSYEFECRNMQCLSMAYRCDGYNDCGCINDCDEDGCGPLALSTGAQIGISIAVGIGVFFVICCIAFLIESKENWLASKNEEKLERETQAAQRRRRATKAFSKFIGDNKDSVVKSKSAIVPALKVTEVESS
ncbi:tolloid-like protein 2 [Aplysia californica]|uniref:Tolloid-like protein 2 n=1 Tax=Aplysia californica TaxID=6500 RepID=A0ABM0JQU6_APLCA|nr:tolloid-like protein 2 [Aplysia californica]